MNEMSRLPPDTQTLLALCEDGLTSAERLLAALRQSVGSLVLSGGRTSPALVDRHQYALHGFAWQATYVEALRRTLLWASSLRDEGRLTEIEAAILRLGFAEYLTQLGSGIPMSQTEMARPGDCGLPADTTLTYLAAPVLAQLADPDALGAARQIWPRRRRPGRYGDLGREDETIAAIRDQFTRFTDTEVAPHAHGWHERDELIPLAVVQQLGRHGRVRADGAGGGWRCRAGQGRDVRRVRGVEPRLYRRGLPRHPVRDRGRADRSGGHGRAEAAVPAGARVWRDVANGGVHRAEHGLGPRQPAHPRRARRGRLRGHRQQDLDHPRRAASGTSSLLESFTTTLAIFLGSLAEPPYSATICR